MSEASTRIMFVRRDSDGKFYRGALFWRWTRSWRRAAALPEDFLTAFILPRVQPARLMTLDEIIYLEKGAEQ